MLFRSKWLLILSAIILGWIIFIFIKIKLQENLVNEEVRELEAKIHSLERSNFDLEKFIVYLKNPSFLEKQARLKLNYKAPGEEVAFIYTDINSRAVSSAADLKKSFDTAPNYIKWWYYLIGY